MYRFSLVAKLLSGVYQQVVTCINMVVCLNIYWNDSWLTWNTEVYTFVRKTDEFNIYTKEHGTIITCDRNTIYFYTNETYDAR